MKAACFFAALLWYCSIPVSVNALTPEQILRLKEKGVEDRTIQMLIEMENQNREKATGLGVKETLRPDGGKDKTYYSITDPKEEIEHQQEEKEKMEKALEILRNLTIEQRRK
jgi:hypothetical protein